MLNDQEPTDFALFLIGRGLDGTNQPSPCIVPTSSAQATQAVLLHFVKLRSIARYH